MNLMNLKVRKDHHERELLLNIRGSSQPCGGLIIHWVGD